MTQPSPTVLAFHLPQYHEVPENNAWWGQGFTEWVHVNAAKPRWVGHLIRRPVPPLGQYDLTDPAMLELQWDIAAQHGIDGFAVWHYWFGHGRQLLERPIEMVLAQKLRFRYCLAWANHSWFNKAENRLLCRQEYPGPDDYHRHFEHASRHFESDNYIRIDGKPVFVIYNPYDMPHWERFVDQWRELAASRGYPGIFFVGDCIWENDAMTRYLDGYSNGFGFMTRRNKLLANYLKEELRKKLSIRTSPRRFDFRRLERAMIPKTATDKFVPTIITGWDTTPRLGRTGTVFEHLGVEAVQRQLERSERFFEQHPDSRRLMMVKSWNEWSEGNVLEPDNVTGFRMLETFQQFRRGTTASAP